MKITHINPEGLYNSPVFSQAVIAEGGKTVYIGGQNGILSNGMMAGADFATQTEQALRNVLVILQSVGATQANVVKLTIHAAKGQSVNVGYAAAQKVWGNFPTAITFVFVEALGVEGALVEVEAIAVVE